MRKALILLPLLAGCATTPEPVTVPAVCEVFPAPQQKVVGATRYSKQWIAQIQEAGIGVCKWERPKASGKK